MLTLYGSQNYNLDTENSDIDCMCFIFPSIGDIAFGRPLTSKTLKTQFGTCTIKDVRTMFAELNKCSPNILEALSSVYNICNKDYLYYVQSLCNNIDFIGLYSKGKLLKGFQGLFNRYAKKAAEDNKYAANVLRIIEVINRILETDEYSYRELLTPFNAEELKNIKLQKTPIGGKEYLDIICKDTNNKLENYFNSHEITFVPQVKQFLDDTQIMLIDKWLRNCV